MGHAQGQRGNYHRGLRQSGSDAWSGWYARCRPDLKRQARAGEQMPGAAGLPAMRNY